MTFQDFHSIQLGHNVTAELFKNGLFWNYQRISVSIETYLAQWLSGRASDSGERGPGFEPHDRRVVS